MKRPVDIVIERIKELTKMLKDGRVNEKMVAITKSTLEDNYRLLDELRGEIRH